MELMLVVWAVSVLSSIKVFLSEYLVYVLVVAIVVYLCSKIKWNNVLSIASTETPEQEWEDGAAILYKDVLLNSGKTAPAGKYTLSVYGNYAYVTGGDFHRETIKRSELEPALRKTTKEPVPEPSVQVLSFVEWTKRAAVVCYCLLGLNFLLPTDNTIKYMAGAYLLQSVYESGIVQKAAPLAERAVMNQLEIWSKDAPDIRSLLETPHDNRTEDPK